MTALDVRVAAVRTEAAGVKASTLESVTAEPLAAFVPGAHIEVCGRCVNALPARPLLPKVRITAAAQPAAERNRHADPTCFNCNDRLRRGNGLDTAAADTGAIMNRLFPRLRDPQERFSAVPRSRDEGQPLPPDPYHGAALGVECAWPLAAEREVTRPLP